ncbi:hypothetical protein GCM10009815_07840 [Nocardioides marmoribigeumensis]
MTSFLCSVGGAQLRFAWFASPRRLATHVARTYPSCRRVSYVLVCRGPGRQALRYADPRLGLQVSAPTSARATLLRVPINPSRRILHGSLLLHR